MQVELPKHNPLFEARYNELTAEGIKLSAHDVAWLYECCRKCVEVDRHAPLAWIAPALIIGDTKLYPLTLQAEMWLDQCVSKWWGDVPEMDILVTCYAMAHGTKAGAFADLCSEPIARKAVMSWAWSLPYTTAQLRFALDNYMDRGGGWVDIENKNYVPCGADKEQYGEFLAFACWHYKRTPAEFLSMPVDQVVELMRNMPNPDGTPRKSADNTTYAQESLRLCIKQIRASHAERVTHG